LIKKCERELGVEGCCGGAGGGGGGWEAINDYFLRNIKYILD
jgi:hypothetical protein